MRTMSVGPASTDQIVWSINECELAGIAKNSLRNCHAVGLDSVMFDNRAGQRVRAFVARKNHEMWMNMTHSLSIAWHPHHCDISLLPVFGDTFNVIPFRTKRDGQDYAAYTYRSPILNEVGGFVHTNKHKMLRCIPVAEPLRTLRPMKASEIHTVYVPKGEESAWYVFEHREDELYESVAWSNTNLTTFDWSRLYKPMTVERLRENLTKLKIEIVEGQ